MKFLLTTFLTLFSTSSFAQGDFCQKLNERMESGFKVTMSINASNLLDADDTWESQGTMLLIPKIVSKACFSRTSFQYVFDRTVIIKSRTKKISAFITNNFSYRYLDGVELVIDSLKTHNSVTAKVLQRYGFDSFESSDSTPFTTMLNVQEKHLSFPFESQFKTVLGVASKDNNLYLISIGYEIDFVN